MFEHLAIPARPPVSGSRRLVLPNGLRVNLRTLADVDERFRRAWRELEADSSTQNPFSSADYVMAAARYLPEVAPLLILTVEERGELLGLGIFENSNGDRRLPVKHLRAWQTPHTYFDVPLLRSGREVRTMERIWSYFLHSRHDWHGVEFPRFPNQIPLTRVFTETSEAAGIVCHKGTCWERASLLTNDCDSGSILQHLSVKRSKSLRRGWRELEKAGTVEFEIQQDPDLIPQCAEELMKLESLGWKSDVGTALASHAAHQRFFREMVGNLNEQNRIFVSRLLVNREAVASVVHLQAGDVAYAFKLGWNPAAERGCPGFQLKLQTALLAQEKLPGIRMIDSCSSPGSFIEHIWPHRRSFCNRLYLTSPVGNLAATMVNGLRWVRNNACAVTRHFTKGPDQEECGRESGERV
ncbi:GNAT family N-acetyltransferase [Planctomicrobium sp. SH661]|uniref:GNAT family N-acetyltransferase n=1 Tax=Planctomicrobium sp. SH661 TaxID=3448124 RepID=UPI003F5CBC4A